MRSSLATLIDDWRAAGRQTAIVTYHGNRTLITSYAQLLALTSRVAAELDRQQFPPGERILLWGRNSAEWIAAFFACMLRGLLVVPLDAAGAPDFATRVLTETSPRLLIGDRDLLSKLPSAMITPQLHLEDLFSLPDPSSPLNTQAIILHRESPLQILFTSGTTSEPKGIVHTHGNVLASVEPIEREMRKYSRLERLFHPVRFLHTLPLSHVFGQFMGIWLPPLLAAEVHFESRLEAERILLTLRSKRITVLAAVPRVLDLLRSHVTAQHPDLPAQVALAQKQSVWARIWRFRTIHTLFGWKFWAFICGGASLPADLEHFWNRLGYAVVQGYGMTETAALITLNHPFKISEGTIGKTLPGRELRIGPDGEIAVRGEMVSTATWQHGGIIQRTDPWLVTGDLATADDEGNLHFLGRKSEIIVNAAGLNIHPEDVEAALLQQPAISACAVVPSTLPSGGEEPTAVLIAPSGPEAAKAAITAANQSLAEYQRIRRWFLWPDPDLPRTATGKVKRSKVTEWVASQQSSGAVNATNFRPDQDQLISLIASITGASAHNADNSLRLTEDLQLDSLGRVQLQSAIEQNFGVLLDDQTFLSMETLGQLRSAITVPSDPTGNVAASPQPASPSTQPHTETKPSPTPPNPRLTAVPHFTYPRWPWWPPVAAIRILFLEAIVRPLVWILLRPRIQTTSSIAPGSRPMLLIVNHVAIFDVPLALYALPPHIRRHTAVAAAGEMLEDWKHARNQGNFFLNAFAPIQYFLLAALFNEFPLPRQAGFRRSFFHIGELLDRGYHVLIFPEGRRSLDGTLQHFRAGIGLLAQESNTAILPIALKGMPTLVARKQRWFHAGLVEIHVGAPIPISDAAPEQIAHSLHDEFAKQLT